MTHPRDPRSDDEWQEAVDLAHFCLQLDAARHFGLVEGGPDIDVARCEDLLTRGRAFGFEPRDLLGATR